VAAVVATSGSGQSTVANSPFGNPLRATVTDASGNAISGVTVTFTTPSNGASATLGGLISINVVTGTNGVASAPVVANGVAGVYSINASVAGVAKPANFALTNIAANSSSGTLSGTATSNATAVNLTAEGTEDWAHWEAGRQDRKSGVTAQISTYSVVGAGTVLAYTNDPRPVSWTDGNPRTNIQNDTSGVYVGGALVGFSITVPADTTVRTLVVHAGGDSSSAVLTASLSDGSAPIFSDSTSFVSTQYDRNYTLVYNAASAGQSLTLTWVLVSGGGNVTLSAAALSGPSITGTAGTPQSASVGTAFATLLQVTVTDGNNNPVSGATVNFSALSSGATATFGGLATASSSTNGNGVALAPSLSANGQSGAYAVTASVAGMAAPPAVFLLTNVAGTPANLNVLTGTPQSTNVNTAFGTPLSVAVSDSNNNPVSGVTVMFTVMANGAGATFGGLASVNTSTYDKGTTTAPALIANGQQGSFTVTASIAGLSPVSFNLTNIVRVPASVTATAGTPQSATVNTAFATTLQVTVTDNANNPVSGVTVTFTAPGPGAGAAFSRSATAIAVTNASGIAMAPGLIANGQPGAYTVAASIAGVTSVASFSLTNNPAPPSGTLTGSGNSASTTASLTSEGAADWVHWGDGSLNRKAGVTAQIGNYTVVGSGGVPSYNNDPRPLSWTDGAPTVSASSNTNGVYINGTGNGFSITAPADTSTRKLTVHVGGWLSGGTFTAHLSDGSAPDYVDVTPAANGQYDRNYSLIYRALGSGQTMTVKWAMSSGAGNVTLNGAALALASPSITATAGSPQSTAVDTAFGTALQATLLDASNNPLSGVTVTFTAPASGATAMFSGAATATATTNGNGVATAPALIANGQIGSFTITASAPQAAPTSFNLTNTAGSPTSVTATAGTPQSATVNTAFAAALAVTVTDNANNPVSGVTVTFTAPGTGAGAAFSGSATATAVTNASGIAIAPGLIANGQTGAYSITAIVAGVTSAASFSLTNLAGSPANIAATAGTPQSATVNVAFVTALQAVVKDASNNPLSGVTVTFASPSAGASAAFSGSTTATAISNASGIATAPALTANSQAGSYTVTASVTGLATKANFNLTNLAGSPASIAATAGTPQSATVNTGFTTALQAVVKDASNNLLSGVTVTFASPSAGASATFNGSTTATAITNASGIAAAPAL
ncbi:MAG: Ig-like domain-containing protein, partial [Bryobacterales bacterium]|nr:Ig-like domain-containing protein [Bryobacterales bacterium]